MSMDNLPPDWGNYYRICPDCGVRYHLSGCEECHCDHELPEEEEEE